MTRSAKGGLSAPLFGLRPNSPPEDILTRMKRA